MPDAGVAHAEDDLVALRPSQSIPMRPPSSVYFAALFNRLARTCSSRVGSPSIGIGPVATETVELRARALDEGADGLDRLRHDRRRRRGVSVFRLDLAAGDPRDVEQVVDESHDVLELALGDVVGPLPIDLGGGGRSGRSGRRC